VVLDHRETTDQIFVVRQMLEKFDAHDIGLYLLLFDFKEKVPKQK
jgi:hypothetical protein